MLKRMTPTIAVVAWLGIIAASVLFGAIWGVPVTVATVALLIVACFVPPGIMLMVWRGAPPPTVAEVLNTVEARNR